MKLPDPRLTAALLVLLTPSANSNAAGVDCLETGPALEYWRPIREQATTSELPANELAIELVSCLGSPDPELRDRIGYELFANWLRQEKLSDETRTRLLFELSANLGNQSKAMGLTRSFSALILAEVMRSDSIKAFMNDEQRQALLDKATAAIAHEDEFRGLDADIGWVHPVAHMADLLWRFALHPKTDTKQAKQILDAVRSKVAPTSVSYAFNEGDRLARVVTTLITSKLIDANSMAAWIQQFEKPLSMEKWSEAFQSPDGMAELHNTKQFLRSLSDQLAGAEIDSAITEPLDALVNGFTQLI